MFQEGDFACQKCKHILLVELTIIKNNFTAIVKILKNGTIKFVKHVSAKKAFFP